MNDFTNDVFGRVARFCDRHIRVFALAVATISGLGAVLFLAPLLLQAVATPLDDADTTPMPGTYAFTFLDAKGAVLGHRGPVMGRRLSLADMPAYLPAAFVAMEDRRFFTHHGVDFIGLSRAAYSDLRAHRIVAGGSTITQQTAKLLLADHDRTIGRKLREVHRAAQLEASLSKAQILDIYLNRIYLGDGAFGVDTAARTYFGVSAHDVTLPQAAMLAALTRAPSVFTPRRDLAAAQARAARVLAAMAAMGAITSAQAQAARATPATIVPRKADDRGYFLDAAMIEAQHVAQENSLPSGELVVHTTQNAAVQAAAENAVSGAVRTAGRKSHFDQAAVVVMSPQGAVLAMVGGADYTKSEFNRVTQARRQPGSAFKPFVYLAALGAGKSPWEQRRDQAVDIDGYEPVNYHHASYGQLRLIDALALSVNTVAVNLAQEVGLGNVIGAARRLGIKSELHQNPSLALGTDVVTPLEMTAAYATFANAGVPAKPWLVDSIVSAGGQALYRHSSVSEPAISDGERRDMTAMLYQVVTGGTGRGAQLAGREVAGKTGTSQDYHDAWFLGFTADLVAGVWVGNDDNAPMKGITGGSIPAQIWRQVMVGAEQGRPVAPLDRSQPPAQDAADTLSPEDQVLLDAENALVMPPPAEVATRDTSQAVVPKQEPLPRDDTKIADNGTPMQPTPYADYQRRDNLNGPDTGPVAPEVNPPH